MKGSYGCTKRSCNTILSDTTECSECLWVFVCCYTPYNNPYCLHALNISYLTAQFRDVHRTLWVKTQMCAEIIFSISALTYIFSNSINKDIRLFQPITRWDSPPKKNKCPQTTSVYFRRQSPQVAHRNYDFAALLITLFCASLSPLSSVLACYPEIDLGMPSWRMSLFLKCFSSREKRGGLPEELRGRIHRCILRQSLLWMKCDTAGKCTT